MARNWNEADAPIGVRAPKKNWRNPQADYYVGPDAPAQAFVNGGDVQRPPMIDFLAQDNPSQVLFDYLMENLGGTGIRGVYTGGLPQSGGGLDGPSAASTATPQTAASSSPMSISSIPGFLPSGGQADYLMRLGQGGSGAPASPQSPLAALRRALAGAYQRQMALLASVLSQAETTGLSAADSALSAVRANPSPYQNIQLAQAQDATNPLAAYMRQLGTSTQQADATLGLINQMNQTQNAGLSQLAANLGTINQNAQNGMVNDIERSKQAFIQQLAQQRAAEELALKNYYSSRGVAV